MHPNAMPQACNAQFMHKLKFCGRALECPRLSSMCTTVHVCNWLLRAEITNRQFQEIFNSTAATTRHCTKRRPSGARTSRLVSSKLAGANRTPQAGIAAAEMKQPTKEFPSSALAGRTLAAVNSEHASVQGPSASFMAEPNAEPVPSSSATAIPPFQRPYMCTPSHRVASSTFRKRVSEPGLWAASAVCRPRMRCCSAFDTIASRISPSPRTSRTRPV